MNDLEALELLWAILSASGQGHHAVMTNDDRRDIFWIDVKNRERFMRLVPELAWQRDASLRPVPLADRGSFRVLARTGVIWARSDTGRSTALLRRFRPLPTLVLRDGQSVRYVAAWALRRPVDPDDAARVSRHLAHRLGTPKKYAAPSFDFRPPGGVYRYGRTRPLPVVVAGGSGEAYTMRELCRTLPRVLPDVDAWRQFVKPRPTKPLPRTPVLEAAQGRLL